MCANVNIYKKYDINLPFEHLDISWKNQTLAWHDALTATLKTWYLHPPKKKTCLRNLFVMAVTEMFTDYIIYT